MKKVKYILVATILMIQFINVSAITLDDIDFNSDNLAIGTFFSSKYDENGSSVDERMGLYVTTNGSDFVYIGETGLTGRDPRVLYLNGVFYLMATKGGSSAGGFAFNVFKSTDLINWTNDTTYPFAHRYDIGKVPDNIYGLPANNWGPKWYMENGKLYIMITTTRFDSYGAKYYYIKGSNVTSEMNPDNLTISDTNKGVLVKEYADLSDGRAQYVKNNTVYYTRDDKDNIYNLNGEKLTNDNGIYTDNTNNCTIDTKNDNKLSCEGKSSMTLKIKTKKEVVTYLKNNVKTIVQATCAWYDYPLFDMYISEVELGTIEEQKDLNYQNLKFKGFSKIKLDGYDFDDVSDKDRLYFLQHGTLFNLIEKNSSDTGYTYAMYLKTDPYGTVQRWVSNSLTGKWTQIDERFYPSDEVLNDNSNDPLVCKSTSKLSSYEGKLYCTTNPCQSPTGQAEYGYNKHFEGAVIADFNGSRYFYSDHYNGNEYGSNPTPQEKTSISGIYFTTLVPNSNGKVDLTDASGHILFNIFHKLNVYNTDIRPSDITDNVVRNGGVYRPDTDMNTFKKIVKNASKFNLKYKIYNTTLENKLIVVVKSNRAIKEEENWYNDGFRFISDMANDDEIEVLNSDLKASFKKYDTSVPYTAKELYLYKVIDKGTIYELTLKDLKGNTGVITINTKEEEIVEVEPSKPDVEEKEEDIKKENKIEEKKEIEIEEDIKEEVVNVENTLKVKSIIAIFSGLILVIFGLVIIRKNYEKRKNLR